VRFFAVTDQRRDSQNVSRPFTVVPSVERPISVGDHLESQVLLVAAETKRHCSKTHSAIVHPWSTPLMIGVEYDHLSQISCRLSEASQFQFVVRL
jgi:hypothetical protein